MVVNVAETELLVFDSAKLSLLRTHRIQRGVETNRLKISADDTVALSVNPRNSIVVWLLADAVNSHTAAQNQQVRPLLWIAALTYVTHRRQLVTKNLYHINIGLYILHGMYALPCLSVYSPTLSRLFTCPQHTVVNQ